MFRTIFTRFDPLHKRTFNFFYTQGKRYKYNHGTFGRATVLPSLLATSYAFYFPLKVNLQDKNQQLSDSLPKEKINDESLKKPEKSFWEKVWIAVIHIIRFFHLALIFMPPILLSPLVLFKSTKAYWMDCFVRAV